MPKKTKHLHSSIVRSILLKSSCLGSEEVRIIESKNLLSSDSLMILSEEANAKNLESFFVTYEAWVAGTGFEPMTFGL